MKPCDHKSVGILVWRKEKLLLIERKKPPYGWAPPAGHVDDFGSYEAAANAELREEVGLKALQIELIAEGRKENWCRRGGKWHYWKIFVAKTAGVPVRSLTETRNLEWYDEHQLRTKLLCGQIEQVWVEWFSEIDIFRFFLKSS